jgi:hypothetical protein
LVYNVYIFPVKQNGIMIQKKLQSISISVIIALLVGSAIVPYCSTAFAQQSQNAAAYTELSSKFGIKPTAANYLNLKMAQLLSSNKLKDIATLAYIWGYSLINMQRTSNWMTNPDAPPNMGNGPWNTINFGRTLANASFTNVVSPNDDTLYGSAWLNLASEPVVLEVPPISDRYYTFQLMDAYTNDNAYVGTRATGSNGGTYLITGPYWNGTVPNGMTQIWSPTELVWVLNRILVRGSADLPNVHAIQDKISVQPLSVFEGKTAAPRSQPATKQTPVPDLPNVHAIQDKISVQPLSVFEGKTAAPRSQPATKQTPVPPQPALIPTTGIKIYDQIGQAMVGNPPNPPDSVMLDKLATLGIGPGRTPSKEAATNSTLIAALQIGITEGEKLIDLQIQNIGIVVNGW